MKILAIDYGTVKIGLALGDINEKISAPYKTISHTNEERSIKEIITICDQENIHTIIIGHEKRWHNTNTVYAQKLRQFIKSLKQKAGLNIIKVDESMTTQISKQYHHDNLGISEDALSAHLILQTYLEKL